MDALLIALLGCLLGEMGDKGQWLALALAARFRKDGAVIAGIVVAAIANAAVGAAAGAFMAPMLGSDARLLFLALALIFLAIGMFWPVRQPDPLASWRTGPFLTTAIGLFILGFGDGAQFLILGTAVRTADPLLAATGGAIGIVAATVPVVLWRDHLFKALPLAAIRRGGGILVLLAGLAAAASALHLA
ncbi:TMEM165/GDT1 family protein [Sphingobium sp. JS3065]|uniref:TMEM165/GDT1 family protein n=1 Tax=Sphingobium sp. JS3065 TaxID=2970925 RepID=UPI00226497AC|nr:TMEM165/GDT1 family protein [Sphingobium sp. JS3065]UZW54719.1 TMEM165/GDT1 family protein [Sphingobium sp. JS3065]